MKNTQDRVKMNEMHSLMGREQYRRPGGGRKVEKSKEKTCHWRTCENETQEVERRTVKNILTS